MTNDQGQRTKDQLPRTKELSPSLIEFAKNLRAARVARRLPLGLIAARDGLESWTGRFRARARVEQMVVAPACERLTISVARVEIVQHLAVGVGETFRHVPHAGDTQRR